MCTFYRCIASTEGWCKCLKCCILYLSFVEQTAKENSSSTSKDYNPVTDYCKQDCGSRSPAPCSINIREQIELRSNQWLKCAALISAFDFWFLTILSWKASFYFCSFGGNCCELHDDEDVKSQSLCRRVMQPWGDTMAMFNGQVTLLSLIQYKTIKVFPLWPVIFLLNLWCQSFPVHYFHGQGGK